MQQVAQGLASLGRGNDTQLVHMTPGEVKGLQSLAMAHGGSLTINPKTGLPEAGFLEDVMPMILTTVATIYGGPAAGAATNAAITYRKTGDIQKSILNAGITYGIGQFAQGAETMGANAGPQLAGDEASKKVLETAVESAPLPTPDNFRMDSYNPEGLRYMQSQGLTPAQIRASAADFGIPENPYSASTEYAEKTFDFKDNPYSKNAIDLRRSYGENINDLAVEARNDAMSNSAAPSKLGNTIEGIKQMGSKAGLKDIYGRMDKYALMGLGAGAASLMQPKPATINTPEKTPTRYANYRYTAPRFNATTGKYENGRYSDVDYSTTQRNAAAGGQIQAPSMPIDLSQNYPGSNITKSSYATLPSTDSQEVVDGYGPKINPFTGAEGMAAGGGIRGLKKGDAIYSDAPGAGPYSDAAEEGPYQGMQAQVENMSPGAMALYKKKAKKAAAEQAKLVETQDMEMAAGGMAALPEYAAGGKLLRGPGDGMSDDIPAVIKGQQPQRAALADGEFVIPADVVSHLGNGSTEAGAKRLYAMMDKVRHARTGRKAQGRQIKAEKYLPA
jgi:hypothetical protein